MCTYLAAAIQAITQHLTKHWRSGIEYDLVSSEVPAIAEDGEICVSTRSEETGFGVSKFCGSAV